MALGGTQVGVYAAASRMPRTLALPPGWPMGEVLIRFLTDEPSSSDPMSCFAAAGSTLVKGPCALILAKSVCRLCDPSLL